MPMYVYCYVFQAPNDATAATVTSDAGDSIGSFDEGSTPNGISGVHSVGGGGFVKVSDTP